MLAGEDREASMLRSKALFEGLARSKRGHTGELCTTRIMIVEHDGPNRRSEPGLDGEITVVAGVDGQAELGFHARRVARLELERAGRESFAARQVHALHQRNTGDRGDHHYDSHAASCVLRAAGKFTACHDGSEEPKR